ncbi:GntR family transcriptional regulator [Agaricicola taiwanensis]|uniref:GntR family transcriptional regulator n=1 Tax=Agaricicola taiwanensis TaxID=591372 RepID=A0A8J3DZC6_9RHOB|nr:GntR family transcriptional regulator [Agaricicola taiwanensis]GGE54753.1 GntR family transcriptional regulator [Agaricicola taiwanensis]
MGDPTLLKAKFNVEVVAAPVRQQVIKALYDAITTGMLKPGQRLVEKDLCELMGVSRPPVREALRQLESEGLVVSLPKRGPIVAKLSSEDVANIYQVRGALEALAAKLFAEKATDEQIRDLETSLQDLSAALESDDIDRTIEAKDRFYSNLTEGSGNPLLGSILHGMKARIQMLRRVSLSSPARTAETMREMNAMLAAIKVRDGEAAFQLSWNHIRNAADNALKILSISMAAAEEAEPEAEKTGPGRR